MSKTPWEFTALRDICWHWRSRQVDGWIAVSRTEVGRVFLFKRRLHPIPANEFWNRVVPGWIERGLCKELPRSGLAKMYGLRLMTLAEIETRLRFINNRFRPLNRDYNDKDCSQFRDANTHRALVRLQHEAESLRCEQLARFDEALLYRPPGTVDPCLSGIVDTIQHSPTAAGGGRSHNP